MSDTKRASKLKGWLVTGLTAAFVVGVIYAFQSIEGAGGDQAHVGEVPTSDAGFRAGAIEVDAGVSLRDELLHATAAQLGIKPVRGVWGVLMERGYAKGVATVVGLADGTASMYISAGGAVTGGKAYGPARLAALRLCDQAADALGDTIPAGDFPAPAKGRVRFYVLTDGGVRTAEGDLGRGAGDGGRDVLASMSEAGDALLAGLREATSKGLIR